MIGKGSMVRLQINCDVGFFVTGSTGHLGLTEDCALPPIIMFGEKITFPKILFHFDSVDISFLRNTLSVSKTGGSRVGGPELCVLGSMVTGDKGHDVLPRFGPS